MDVHIKSGDAQFKNLNIRAEGPADDAIAACDCKFECIVDGSILQTLLGADELPDFWSDKGEPKYYGLTGMGSWAEIKEANVKFGDIEIVDAKVGKFGFVPTGGKQVKMTLTVQARPTDEQYLQLLHAQLRHDSLEIVTKQADLFE